MQRKKHKHETAANSDPSSSFPRAQSRQGAGRTVPLPVAHQKGATGTQLALLPGTPTTENSLLSPRLLVDVGKHVNFLESQSELA